MKGNDAEVRAAAENFAAVWDELMPLLPDSYGCEMNCGEADAAADLFRVLGRNRTADAILSTHTEHDTEEDYHLAEGN